MQLAKCKVIIGRFGDTVNRTDVTPAEVQVLVLEHFVNAGRIPIIDLEITGEVARTPQAEKERLKGRYDGNPDVKKNKIEQIFPGMNPNFPATFADIVDNEGNHPFDKTGKIVKDEAKKTISVDGKEYTVTELENLVRAGQAVLKPATIPAPSRSETDQNEEED